MSMPPNNPMTEGEALAVEAACAAFARLDGIADWSDPSWQATHQIEAGRLRTRIRAALTAHTAASGGEVVAWMTPESIAHLAKQNGVAKVDAWNCASGSERVPVYTAPPSAPVGVEAMRSALTKVRDRFFPADQPERDRDELWDDVNNALTQQPAQAAPVCLTADEREWLDYAIEHMRDDSEPEDLTCADVLEALLQRATPPGDDAAGGGHG